MKKILSLCLVLVMALTLCTPAFANEVSCQEPMYGYTFVETELPNGDVEIRSYYNGEFQKKYTIQLKKATILVERATSGETYTINSAESVARIVPRASAYLERAEQWASCGYINYSTHLTLGKVKAYVMAYGNSETTELPLNVKKSSPFDDIVVFLASFILSTRLDKLLEAKYHGASQIARALLSSILAERGVAVSNGLIQSAFTDTVKAYITEWDFKATPSTSGGDTVYLYNQGKTQLIMHTGNVEWDETSEGFTVYDWKHSTLALRLWNEMFPDFTCPGIASYTSR